jgi:OTU domain-containing protein 5
MQYMEQERDYFSQFVTEDFSEYIARKKLNATFGNHLELQAISEMYNRPIEIFAYNEGSLGILSVRAQLGRLLSS